jgi:hypothetical protein
MSIARALYELADLWPILFFWTTGVAIAAYEAGRAKR